MSKKVKIMAIQTNARLNDKETNIHKIISLVKDKKWFQPDLIVLPEMFLVGTDPDTIKDHAEPIPGPTYQQLKNLVIDLQCYMVAGSYAEQLGDQDFRNTSLLLGPNGDILAKYHKIHMFSHLGGAESDYITPGNELVIAETPIGKIGLSICYDLRFPEMYRAMTYAGAEIIVCPARWPAPRVDHWITLNKARAIENLVYMVAVNHAGQEGKDFYLGPSMIIDPWGDIIASTGTSEGVAMCEIDLSLIHTLRERFPVLQDRKMETYQTHHYTIS